MDACRQQHLSLIHICTVLMPFGGRTQLTPVQAMPEQVFVSPWGTGSFAAIACTGVSCVRPPKGISTVPCLLYTSRCV